VKLLWDGLAMDDKLTVSVYRHKNTIIVYLDGTRYNLVSGNFTLTLDAAREFGRMLYEGAEIRPEGTE
jgi:hypothetical protein